MSGNRLGAGSSGMKMRSAMFNHCHRKLGKKINPKSPKNTLSLKCFQNKWDQSAEQCTAMDKWEPFGRGTTGITLENYIIKTQEKWLVSVSWQKKMWDGRVWHFNVLSETMKWKQWCKTYSSNEKKKKPQKKPPKGTTLKICDQCLIFWGLSNKINKDFLLD